jgi:hypothetical protein
MLLVVALPLSACGSGGFDMSETDIDQSSVTGALPTSGNTPDAVRAADETTIRNAVSSADPEQARLHPLAWANSDTGSRGAISSLMERQDEGLLCRKFTASRESFDGVALYAGDACKGERGTWFMRTFKPL